MQLSSICWWTQGRCRRVRSQRICYKAVASLVLFPCPAIHDDLIYSQKQEKVKKTYFTSNAAVVCYLIKQLCRKMALYLMMPYICLFNLQLLYEGDIIPTHSCFIFMIFLSFQLAKRMGETFNICCS